MKPAIAGIAAGVVLTFLVGNEPWAEVAHDWLMIFGVGCAIYGLAFLIGRGFRSGMSDSK